MNIYTKTIINDCYQNGVLASADSFCCSSTDPLCLQQYYTIKNIKESIELQGNQSETIDVSELKNIPIRFFADKNNNIIISTIKDFTELWWDWSIGQFRLPGEILELSHCVTIIKDDASILDLNNLLNKSQNFRIQMLIKSPLYSQDFDCDFTYVDQGFGPMINVLTVCDADDSSSDKGNQLGLLTGRPFSGNFLNSFAIDQNDRMLKMAQVSFDDQMVILPINKEEYEENTNIKIRILYKYIDKNTGENMFTVLNTPTLQTIIVPTMTLVNTNIRTLISAEYEVIFSYVGNKGDEENFLYGPCYGGITKKKSLEYFTNIY